MWTVASRSCQRDSHFVLQGATALADDGLSAKMSTHPVQRYIAGTGFVPTWSRPLPTQATLPTEQRPDAVSPEGGKSSVNLREQNRRGSTRYE